MVVKKGSRPVAVVQTYNFCGIFILEVNPRVVPLVLPFIDWLRALGL
ncbi:hypothetical protein H1P_6370005 [Hyella patelloides LEGE 07179]|uniref:Uncharacterized protein n=1 Tax=Hyella patelloides LEGE 07179 TaxID=945734 RepID=A0A563W251_9CYAN|nr:hypothetical protein H1P_6370005 [Hyella patelloides LEGE 07179]